jgi:hypothetical protein
MILLDYSMWQDDGEWTDALEESLAIPPFSKMQSNGSFSTSQPTKEPLSSLRKKTKNDGDHYKIANPTRPVCKRRNWTN